MMSSDLFFRDKIPVVILGATGKMGEELIQKLLHHPWFQIIALYDAPRHEGGSYPKVVSESFSLPEDIKNIVLRSCEVPIPFSLVFSFLEQSENPVWKEKFLAESKAYVIASTLQKEGAISVTIKLKSKIECEKFIQTWDQFRGESERLSLPSAHYHPFFYQSSCLRGPGMNEITTYFENTHPSSSMDLTSKFPLSNPCLLDVTFMLLIGEFLVANGYIFW